MITNPDTVPRDQVRAVLEAIREDGRAALTGPVHHAYAESALKLEQLLGETPGSREVGDLSKMRPDSAFAEGVAAGHPVEMTMVKPEECALFVLVDMAGLVNAQAVGLPQPDAGAVLRYLADQWDPERTGSAAIRPAAPRTRPNGDPL